MAALAGAASPEVWEFAASGFDEAELLDGLPALSLPGSALMAKIPPTISSKTKKLAAPMMINLSFRSDSFLNGPLF
jgi:hypothetical protein